jgi:hypothetical protein
MGFLDTVKEKFSNLFGNKGKQVGESVDKAADVVDDKTGGKYTGQIDKGADKAKDTLDALDGDEDIPDSKGTAPS